MDLLCRHHYRASIPQPERARAQELVQELVVVKNKPFLHDLPDKAGLRIAFGDTMRRSIPRTGRNEPCHCGSGRKYKHGSFRHAARPHYRVRARFSAAVESCAAPRCGSRHDDAGRSCGGQSAAFVGALRLKACAGVMRHRTGLDWRLLFRRLPDRIEAVDLIPRQDLERRVKTLVTQYG